MEPDAIIVRAHRLRVGMVIADDATSRYGVIEEIEPYAGGSYVNITVSGYTTGCPAGTLLTIVNPDAPNAPKSEKHA